MKSTRITRREFSGVAAGFPFAARIASSLSSNRIGGLTDVPGLKVGHFTDSRRPTGCTVVLAEAGAVAGVDVRGSAPGTRETDLLDPVNTVSQVHAVVLSGGSAFGLDTATGVVRYLEERGIGFNVSVAKVPIVPAAILFDLGLGDPTVRPNAEAGYTACVNASSGPVPEGCVGAGAGATVGKLLGMSRAMKSGLGTVSLQVGDLIVAALVAVNCIGDVIDPSTGSILAGLRTENGKSLASAAQILKTRRLGKSGEPGENTTLAVVGTNAAFSKTAMTKIAQMSHDGLARAINPVHLPFDGDTVFALSTSSVTGADLGQVGALAAEAVALAINRAVITAEKWGELPSHADLQKEVE